MEVLCYTTAGTRYFIFSFASTRFQIYGTRCFLVAVSNSGKTTWQSDYSGAAARPARPAERPECTRPLTLAGHDCWAGLGRQEVWQAARHHELFSELHEHVTVSLSLSSSLLTMPWHLTVCWQCRRWPQETRALTYALSWRHPTVIYTIKIGVGSFYNTMGLVADIEFLTWYGTGNDPFFILSITTKSAEKQIIQYGSTIRSYYACF